MPRDAIDSALLKKCQTQNGQTLEGLLQAGPVLLVFLRHFG